MNIKWVGAHKNNYGVGRSGKKINKVVLHWIVGTLESADATFAKPDRLATAHYGIGDDDVHQYVKEEDTAWHASNLLVNQESVGIEHEGGWLLQDNKTRFKPTDKTHQTSAQLVFEICKRYGIPIDKDHIFPHNKFSSTQCPGLLEVERIISEAKKLEGGGTSMPNTSSGSCLIVNNDEGKKLFDKLVGNSTKWDETVRYLEINSDPKDTPFDQVKSTIAGYKSRVTTLQDENGSLKGELNNRIDQVRRLEQEKEQSAKLATELQTNLQNALKDISKVRESYEGALAVKQEQVDKIAREKGELNTQLTTLQVKYDDLLKSTNEKLTAGELFSMFLKKLLGR